MTIPGRVLHLSALLNKKKFRKKGDKDGAVAGFRLLEKANLGKVEALNPKRGSLVPKMYWKMYNIIICISIVFKFLKKMLQQLLRSFVNA